MDCIVHGVAKSRTWLSDFHFRFHGVHAHGCSQCNPLDTDTSARSRVHIQIHTGMHNCLDTRVHVSQVYMCYTCTHAHIHRHLGDLHTFLLPCRHTQEQTSTCTNIHLHMCPSLKHTGVCTYQISIWIPGCSLVQYAYRSCVPVCTLIYAHRLHVHGTSHMYMCVQVNTLSNCDLSPKPPYSAIAPSYPGELSRSLTREWVTNATAELFWHFWWITFNTINWNNCFSFN